MTHIRNVQTYRQLPYIHTKLNLLKPFSTIRTVEKCMQMHISRRQRTRKSTSRELDFTIRVCGCCVFMLCNIVFIYRSTHTEHTYQNTICLLGIKKALKCNRKVIAILTVLKLIGYVKYLVCL